MKNTPNDWKCDCPMECTSISYTFSLVSTPFIEEELCPHQDYYQKYDFLMKPYYENKTPSPFVRKLMKTKSNASFDEREICKEKLQYMAEVNFKLVTDTLTVTVMSRRLSFFDKGLRPYYVIIFWGVLPPLLVK